MTLPLEKQVVSLPLAQRLEKLVIPQKSHFYWSGNEKYGFVVKPHDELFTYPEAIKISAYTVSELGEILGKASPVNFHKAYMEVMAFRPGDFNPTQAMHNVMTDPDIGALMIAYLIENKLITI